jgi:hypothetical protein
MRWPIGQGIDNKIDAAFRPEPPRFLSLAAQAFNYHHFNWISAVMNLPIGVTEFRDWQGAQMISPPSFMDPPPGGYDYFHNTGACGASGPTADFLPYFWNEQEACSGNFLLDNIAADGTTLNFEDHPHSEQLGPSDYIQFATTLVGVHLPVLPSSSVARRQDAFSEYGS